MAEIWPLCRDLALAYPWVALTTAALLLTAFEAWIVSLAWGKV